MSGHGQHKAVPVESLLTDDDLAVLRMDDDDYHLSLVTADLDAWHEAHPCRCTGGLCECEE